MSEKSEHCCTEKMMGEMKHLVSTLTMERQGLSLLRRCLAPSGLSTPAHLGEEQ